MELSDFISGAVMEVMAGIEKAQKETFKKYGKSKVAPPWEESGFNETQILELTATVTAVEGSKGNAGVSVMSMVKGGLSAEESLSKASTVKIQIPVRYPVFDPEQT